MILYVILGIAILLSLGIYGYRMHAIKADADELHDLFMEAEQRATIAETELKFLKDVISQHVHRPQIAVMSEDQFLHLVTTIQATVESIVRPNSIN